MIYDYEIGVFEPRALTYYYYGSSGRIYLSRKNAQMKLVYSGREIN